MRDFLSTLRTLPTAILAAFIRPSTPVSPAPEVKDAAMDLLRMEKLVSRMAALGRNMQFLPHSENFTEETDAMRAAYPVMLREPMVKASLYTKIFAVAALDIQVQPGGEKPVDKDAADFVKWSLQKSKRGTRGIVTAILVGGLIQGYSLGAKKTRIARDGRWAGKVTLEAIRPKDPSTYELIGDEFRNVTLVRDRRTHEEYDPSHFVLFQHLPLYDNVTGMSDFRAAYRAYVIKDTAWKLRAIGLERFTLPMLQGTYVNDDDRAVLEEALKQARSQSWMALPESVKVTAMELALRSQSDFQAAIADLDKEIVTGIAGAVLQMLEGQVANGRGNSETHRTTTELFQWELAAEVGDIITEQIVPDLVNFNFIGAAHPVVTFGGVNDSAMVASLTIDEGLQRMGMILSKKELYARYGRQKPLDQADTIEVQQPGMMPPRPTPPVQFAEKAQEDGIADQIAATLLDLIAEAEAELDRELTEEERQSIQDELFAGMEDGPG